MSESLAVVSPAVVSPAAVSPVAREHAPAMDARRKLQLALGAIWLLDGLLQYQPFMFSKGFPQMLAGSAQGNPGLVAHPVTWSAAIIGQHLAISNGAFATIQVVIGLGIAWRPTVKPALAASIAWALAVWWLGEGLGGVLTGNASPLAGAPGAVVLYALLAVLLWPADRDPDPPFPAARAIGPGPARATWLLAWSAMALLALLPGSRAPRALSSGVAAMVQGQPGWLAWLDTHAASALGDHGLAVSIALAAILAVTAAGVYRYPKPAVVAALVLAVVCWLAEGTGGLLTGTATDPNTGPLLALLALSYWPAPYWPAPCSPAPGRI
jgi:hypothetical protein